MAELSAAEILHAQLNHEVATAKQDVDLAQMEHTQLSPVIENLAEAVCRRWWLGRMLKKPEAVDMTALQERMRQRGEALQKATMAMITQQGGVDVGALNIAVFSISAEVNALWGALIEAGMMTSRNRQDYMDAAVENLCQRVNEQAKKIVVAGSARAS
ncbi:MAG TPA: hypothetical protein VNH83_16590 [Bryobacteraceae bacterium]|nr:hypothetical protein [Bryobacteraceae bacterium]